MPKNIAWANQRTLLRSLGDNLDSSLFPHHFGLPLLLFKSCATLTALPCNLSQ